MKFQLRVFFLILFLCCILIPNQVLHGQGCCSGGAPLSGNLDIANLPARTLSVRLIYDHNNLSDLLVNKKELKDKTRTRLSNSTLLRLHYSFHKKFGITALLAYSHQIEKVEFTTFANRSEGHGFGDAIFLGQYNLINNNIHGASAAIGIKVPSGSISRLNKDTGLLLPPDLQPGTGAIDYLFSSQYTRQNIFNKNIGFHARLTYTMSTAAQRFNSQQIYEFGNELQLFAGISQSFFLKKSILRPQLTLNYRHTTFDQTNSIRTANTGGHWTYLLVSTTSTLTPNLSFFVQAALPLYRNLDGVQLSTSYRISTSLNYTFTFEDQIEIIDPF